MAWPLSHAHRYHIVTFQTSLRVIGRSACYNTPEGSGLVADLPSQPFIPTSQQFVRSADWTLSAWQHGRPRRPEGGVHSVPLTLTWARQVNWRRLHSTSSAPGHRRTVSPPPYRRSWSLTSHGVTSEAPGASLVHMGAIVLVCHDMAAWAQGWAKLW